MLVYCFAIRIYNVAECCNLKVQSTSIKLNLVLLGKVQFIDRGHYTLIIVTLEIYGEEIIGMNGYLRLCHEE